MFEVINNISTEIIFLSVCLMVDRYVVKHNCKKEVASHNRS